MSSPRPQHEALAPSARRFRNRWAALPAVRWLVQAGWALFLLAACAEFHDFYEQARSGQPLTAHRPAVSEAFLPLSALLALKRLALTGEWDDLHPAGLTILLALLVGALLARKAFCSWICPIGTLSRAVEWLGEKTVWRNRRQGVEVPAWLDRLLLAPKYLMLAAILWMLLVEMDLPAISEFLASPFNLVADARLLLFFTGLTAAGVAVLAALALASMLVKNAWCRYLCPYGALLGIFSWFSPQRIVRDPASCSGCARCTRSCPMQIRVHARSTVTSPECTGCLSCVAACPVEDGLAVGRRGGKGWSPAWIPALALGTLLACWAVARVTGHWTSRLPTQAFAEWYRHATELGDRGSPPRQNAERVPPP